MSEFVELTEESRRVLRDAGYTETQIGLIERMHREAGKDPNNSEVLDKGGRGWLPLSGFGR